MPRIITIKNNNVGYIRHLKKMKRDVHAKHILDNALKCSKQKLLLNILMEVWLFREQRTLFKYLKVILLHVYLKYLPNKLLTG